MIHTLHRLLQYDDLNLTNERFHSVILDYLINRLNGMFYQDFNPEHFYLNIECNN